MKFITFIVFAGMALAQGNRPPAAPPPPATVDDGSTVTITGNLVVNPIATQPAPTLQVLGTAGASTCTYSVVAKNSGGGIAGGAPTASVANCAATLSTSQAVSIKTAATIGATNCDVYRTAGHTSTGKIANVACGSTVVDIGLAGDGASAPATNNTGSFNLLGGGGTPTFAGLQVNGNANVTGNLSIGNTLPQVLGPTGYATVTDASPIAWNLNGQSVTNGIVTLAHGTATRALNVTNLLSGGFYTLIVKQDSTGGAAITGGTGCTWLTPGGLGTGAFAISTAASAVNIIQFSYDGTNCLVIPAAAFTAM